MGRGAIKGGGGGEGCLVNMCWVVGRMEVSEGGGILLPTHLQELPQASRLFLPRVGPVYTFFLNIPNYYTSLPYHIKQR